MEPNKRRKEEYSTVKKVLQISNYYYPHIGGIEQVARDISNVLKDEAEYEVKVICFNENSADDEHICKREETIREVIDGVEIIKCGCLAKAASQSLSLTFGKEMRKVMRDFAPDIVIFHYPNPFQAFFLLRDISKKAKLVLYWHLDITKQKVLKKLFYGQNRRLIERADVVAGATPIHVNTSEFTPFFGEKKKVLPYMINMEELQLSEDESIKAEAIRNRYPGKKIGFFIGRHIPYKGLKYLIEASKQLKREDIQILIAGSGELTESLKEQAAGDNKVEFLGRISDADRRAYFKACDFIYFHNAQRGIRTGVGGGDVFWKAGHYISH